MIAPFIRAVARTAERTQLKQRIPLRLVQVLRFILLRNSVQRFPDRRYFEDQILPAVLHESPRRTLFVGCEPYTKSYSLPFRARGLEYWTTDIKAEAASWGEGPSRHLTADIRDIASHFEPRYFDLILLNGVFGFGVDDVGGMDRTLEGIASRLTPKGRLVIGWNPHLIEADLETLPNLQRLFEPSPLGDLPARTDFFQSEVPHCFVLLKHQK